MQQQDEVVLFYGHSKGKPYACFSNWYPAPFQVDGLPFANTEQYMMYRKALLMGDDQTAAKVLREPNPKNVKALGRKVTPWKEDVWCQHREQIMFDGCLAKFEQNPELKRELLSTHPRRLAEASPFDRIWGIGMGATTAGASDPTKWKGLNLLGIVLERVRSQLA